MKTIEMEIVLSHYFNHRQNLIVPNVSWSYFMHELDLLILSRAGYAREIEIKVSMSDLKRESFKHHNHESRKIRQLYFAISENVFKHKDFTLDLIPERAGLLVIEKNPKAKPNEFKIYNYRVTEHRKAKIDINAEKWQEKDITNVTRLGAMRIWTLKKQLFRRM
jgi:hypothetical protein